MTDTNGHVAAAHLGTFAGYPVSLAILPDLRAADRQFHAEGYTFGLVLGFPGYRDWDIQGAMQRAFDAGEFDVAPYYLSGAKGTRPGNPGRDRHGFGRAIDVFSNAPLARRDAILAAHGFHLWSAADRNHYDWGNALQPAALDVVGLNESKDMDMITRRLVRQINTPGVYYAVDNLLSPVISEAHLANVVADMKGLQAAGDPFLVQAGPAAFDVVEVADLRLAGILPATSTSGGATDPTPVLAAIAALAKQDSADQAALLAAISQVDENTLASFGLKRA